MAPKTNSVPEASSAEPQSATGLTEQMRKLNVAAHHGLVTKVLDDAEGDVITMDFPISFFDKKATVINAKIKGYPGTNADKNSSFISEIKTFFAETEAQISHEALAPIAIVLWKSLLKDTIFDGLSKNYAANSWKVAIADMSSTLNVTEIEKSRKSFYSIEAISPNENEDLRIFFARSRAEIAKVRERTTDSSLPPAYLFQLKIRDWIPAHQRSYLPATFDPNTSSTWEDNSKLVDSLSKTFPFGSMAFKKRAAQAAAPQAAAPQPGRVSHPQAKASHAPNAEIAPSSTHVVKEKEKAVPAEHSPAPKAKAKAAGSLNRLAFHPSKVRLDSGADQYILGEDLCPFAETVGPSPHMFTVPLKHKKVAPELGKVVLSVLQPDNTLSDPIEVVGVLSPHSSSCFPPDGAISFNGIEGHTTIMGKTAALVGVPNPIDPKKHCPYLTVMVSSLKTSSLRSLGIPGKDWTEPTVRLAHRKFGCAGVTILSSTLKLLSVPAPHALIAKVCSDCSDCPKLDNFNTFKMYDQHVGLLSGERLREVFVYDIGEVNLDKQKYYLLCGKLLRSNFAIARYIDTRGCVSTELKKIVGKFPQIGAAYCDRASDFSPFKTFCVDKAIDTNLSSAGRPEAKGRQEAAVRTIKTAMNWVAKIIDSAKIFEDSAHHHPLVTTVAAEYFLNTRTSVENPMIPWSVIYGTKPRYDLLPLSSVSLVVSAKIGPNKTKTAFYLAQRDPQTAALIVDGELQFHDMASVRSPLPSLGALSLSATKLSSSKSPEAIEGIRKHIEKIIKYNPFEKIDKSLIPSSVPYSFFTGRDVVDIEGTKSASMRLVVNNALTVTEELDSSLPSVTERLLFMCLSANYHSKGWCFQSIDEKGAYYATPGSGFLRLPQNFPEGFGFRPLEVVKLRCAMPGDKASSALHLDKHRKLLGRSYKRVTDSTFKSEETLAINYSDDSLSIHKDRPAANSFQNVIKEGFDIEVFDGLPEKWVSWTLTADNGIRISMSHTVATMLEDCPIGPTKFTLAMFCKEIPNEKSKDTELIKEAQVWAGKLNYVATVIPHLAWAARYASSIATFDPESCRNISIACLQAYNAAPISLHLSPIEPKFIACYVDGSLDTKEFSGSAGCLVQLQLTDEPEVLGNIVGFKSSKLKELVNSSFGSEARSLIAGLEYLISILPVIKSFYDLQVVIFIDNKGLVQRINDVKGLPDHPFHRTHIDFARQEVKRINATAKWCPTDKNLSDMLTKSKKPF